MDDFKRYEDELAERLKNLSMPDKKLAWEKMEKLLDDGGNDGGFMPPSSTRGNKPWGWGLFGLLAVVGIVWFCFHVSPKENIPETNNSANNKVSENNTSVKNTVANVPVKNDPAQSENTSSVEPSKKSEVQEDIKPSSDIVKAKAKDNVTGNNSTNDTKVSSVDNSQSFILSKHTDAGTSTSNASKISILHSKTKLKTNSFRRTSGLVNNINKPETTKTIDAKNATYHLAIEQKISRKKDLVEKSISVSSTKKNILLTRKGKYKSAVRHLGVEDELAEQDNVNNATITVDSSRTVSSQQKTILTSTDSTLHKDSIVVKPLAKAAKDSSATAKKKDEKNKKKKAYFAAGLGEQQNINLNCNCVYHTSTNTDAGSIKDFLPAPYLRFYSVKKWFLQAAFKYATPQHIGDFMYRSSMSGLIDTSYVLRDVYYHQIPISFNYTVLPNWSVGAGVVYNIYSSEIRQEDISKKIYGSPDSIISSTIIKDKKDSNSLSLSNYFQAMLETEYQWKHFSIGMNYTVALEPFAKYSDPRSGSSATKSNNSLNVFIRYELWRSK